MPDTDQLPSDYDYLMQTLAAVGGAGIDVVPLYFARLFSMFPEEEVRFVNAPSTQGSMVNEMIGMLLANAAGESWVAEAMTSEVESHRGYGEISLERYRCGIDCLLEVLKDASENAWTAATGAAWRRQADELLEIIEAAH